MCKIAPQFWRQKSLLFYDFIYQTIDFMSNFQAAIAMKNSASLQNNLLLVNKW